MYKGWEVYVEFVGEVFIFIKCVYVYFVFEYVFIWVWVVYCVIFFYIVFVSLVISLISISISVVICIFWVISYIMIVFEDGLVRRVGRVGGCRWVCCVIRWIGNVSVVDRYGGIGIGGGGNVRFRMGRYGRGVVR